MYYIRESLKQIEAAKLKYPELLFKESDKSINNFLEHYYTNMSLPWNGYMLRRPKIMMTLDDLSGTSLF